MHCKIFLKELFFFYFLKVCEFGQEGDYLLVVDISQDASQDLQQEDAQQQDKVLERKEKKIQLVDGNFMKRQVALKLDVGAFKVTPGALLERLFKSNGNM